MLSLLGELTSTEDELAAVSTEGLCKLYFVRSIADPKLLSHLIIEGLRGLRPQSAAILKVRFILVDFDSPHQDFFPALASQPEALPLIEKAVLVRPRLILT